MTKRVPVALAFAALLSAVLGCVAVPPARASSAAVVHTVGHPLLAESTGPSTAAVKYYVVGQPRNGQPEYLYEIALRTLGNGKRLDEIFNLNRGRLQPDGGRLTDPMVLHPGWVLLLPVDARGDGVHMGLPPTPAAGRSDPGATQTVPATDPTGRPADAGGSGGVSVTVIRIGALLAAVLSLAMGLRLARARHAGGGSPPAAVADDEPVPSGPDAGPAGASDRPQRQPPPAARPPALPDRFSSAGISAGEGPVPPASSRGANGSRTPAVNESGSPAVNPAHSPGVNGARTPVVNGARPNADATPSSAAIGTGPSGGMVMATSRRRGPAPVLDAPDGAQSAMEPEHTEHTNGPRPPQELLTSLTGPYGQRVTVRLTGVRGGRRNAGYAWLARGEQAPPSSVPLVLGSLDGWRLHVDLSASPDLVTVTGAAATCHGFAADLAGQARRAGLAVTVVGDVPADSALPEGCRRVRAFPGVDGVPVDVDRPGIVICDSLDGPALLAARRLLTDSGGRVVPVVTGPVPAARWSVRVDEPGAG